MQKNVPKYAPSWVRTVTSGRRRRSRSVAYALCNDRRTLLWFANQRAVEYHPALAQVERPDRITHLVLDLDPPDGDAFAISRRVARLVRAGARRRRARRRDQDQRRQGSAHLRADRRPRLDGGFGRSDTRAIAARAEPLEPDIATTAFMKEDRGGKVFVDATRVGGATVIAAYSPRVRPGVPVSFPLSWDRLDDVVPADFTVHNALEHLDDRDPWVGVDARSSVAAGRARRGRPRDPGRPRAGHARRQTPRPRPSPSLSVRWRYGLRGVRVRRRDPRRVPGHLARPARGHGGRARPSRTRGSTGRPGAARPHAAVGCRVPDGEIDRLSARGAVVLPRSRAFRSRRTARRRTTTRS